MESILGATKRKLRLQNKLEVQRKLHTITARISHDIYSQISSLRLVTSLCKNKISATEQKMLELFIASIWSIVNSLFSEYKDIKNAELSSGHNKIIVNKNKTEEYVSSHLGLNDMINSKRYQYQKSNTIFNYRSDSNQKFVFIKGNSSDFYRMMSNVVNNAV